MLILNYLIMCVWQENGVLEDYQLASDGVDQARAAGELFLKALHLLNLTIQESFPFCVVQFCLILW